MPRSDNYDTIVVGGGAAGLMASFFASENGTVLLIEKNEKLGKKIYITGKGRCNFTNTCDTDKIYTQVVSNARFLYSAISGFDNFDVMDFFKTHGLKIKEERGGRVFPVSDKASDVTKTLEKACREVGVEILLNAEVNELTVADISEENPNQGDIPGTQSNSKKIIGITLSDGRKIKADKVILATGGLSYPSTGSTGDGYRFAKTLGHRVTETRPGLTGMNTAEDDIHALSGLTLVNTSMKITSPSARKPLYEGFGELLFTHFGVSGPTVLSASSILGDRLKKEALTLHIDIKPALDEKKFDDRLLREICTAGKKSISNILQSVLPKSLISVIIHRCGVTPDTRGFDLKRDERLSLVREMKDFKVTLTSVREFTEAIITRGGVDVRDINPSTMESRIVRGLYFAGELIDVDALTGGYNLQIAWSTGALAGKCKNKIKSGDKK